MSRKACSPDNAACEGFFGRLKNELFYPRSGNLVANELYIHPAADYAAR
jgi:transposase InsO family protein